LPDAADQSCHQNKKPPKGDLPLEALYWYFLDPPNHGSLCYWFKGYRSLRFCIMTVSPLPITHIAISCQAYIYNYNNQLLNYM